MEKWADYCISQIKWDTEKHRLIEIMVHEDKGETIGLGYLKNRNWIIQKIENNKSFITIQRTEKGKWNKTSVVKLENGALKWNDKALPFIKTKRKTFVSYYHFDDQSYQKKFYNLTSDLIVNKSVGEKSIDDDNSDAYIKKLIQDGFLSDTTVLAVLVGNKTYCRKHVDWEISGALDLKVGESYSGLLGILLPTHPDFGKEKDSYNNLPKRLAENAKTGYAKIYDWTTNRPDIQTYIEDAYTGRTSRIEKRTNRAIPQMQRNSCK